MQSLLQVLRFGFRSLAKHPVFAMVALMTLAVGIGVTTATFSVVDRLLFRSLPYPEDDRLVSMGIIASIEPTEFMMSGAYFQWKPEQTPFEAMTSWSGVTPCDLTEQNPVELTCARVE